MEKRTNPWNPKNLEKPWSHEKVCLPLRHDVAEFELNGADCIDSNFTVIRQDCPCQDDN